MTEVRFCRRCVISNQRPRIVFDEDGICFACKFREYERTQVDWADRHKQFTDLLARFRSDNGDFDCIVPSSGGKDSAVVAHRLKHEYGMHPLTVTWAPHIYTDIGRKNFQGLIDAGLSNILITAAGPVHRKLTRLSTEELGDPFQPFIYGQVIQPVRIALMYGIKLIFSGENGEAAYSGNPEAWDNPGFKPGDYDKLWFSGVPVEHWLDRGFSRSDLGLYLPPAQEEIAEAGIQRFFWSYFHHWTPTENFYYATEHTGFEANPEGRSIGTFNRYASLDDQLDPFHYWFGLLKFGLGRSTSDAAHEIRDGYIDREEGIALVRRYDTEFPAKALPTFLQYTGMTEAEFWATAEKWRNPDLWERVNGEWALKYAVWKEGVADGALA